MNKPNEPEQLDTPKARDVGDQSVVIERVDYWLAEVNQYGYANELHDGPHSDREGVEQALYLIRGLGLERGRKFCCVRVEQSPVEPKAHDTNEEALSDCRMMVDRSTSR